MQEKKLLTSFLAFFIVSFCKMGNMIDFRQYGRVIPEYYVYQVANRLIMDNVERR